MVGEIDQTDKNESRKLAIALILLLMVLGIAVLLMLPLLSDIVNVHLSPGLGLKDAAIISFFVTAVMMIIFAITSGDGVLGEIQFVLGGFFLFFMIIWILIAWVF